MKELLIYISIICIFLIGLSLYVFIQSKNNDENDIQVLINKIKKIKLCFTRGNDEKNGRNPIYTKKKPRNREND